MILKVLAVQRYYKRECVPRWDAFSFGIVIWLTGSHKTRRIRDHYIISATGTMNYEQMAVMSLPPTIPM